MRSIILIAHNLRSSHNVGSLLRTAEGLEVTEIYLTGYTPYPQSDEDRRLPYLAQRIEKAIAKTALGAEKSIKWQHLDSVEPLIAKLHSDGYQVIALEQVSGATELPDFRPPQKLALVVGREVEGIEPAVIALCDQAVVIPMLGQKESFNVVQAAAMTLYHCRFYNHLLK